MRRGGGGMWSIYSRQYLKKNRAASLFIVAAVFISTVFLSFLITLFANLWTDERTRALYEGRTWQPTLLTGIYAVILFLVCGALLLMIYYAFEMTKGGRMHQLGILQSVGATPGQIYGVLMQEAFVLGALPLIPGMLPGIALTWLFTEKANEVNRIVGNMEATFVYGPKLFFLTALICLLTVWLAAAGAARSLSRIGVWEALRTEPERVDEKNGHRMSPSLTGLLGNRIRIFRSLEWEMARRSMRGRKKAFRAASLSLTLSCTAYGLFMNFWVISGESRRITYFDRYWDTWDAQRRIVEMTQERLTEQAYTMTMEGLCILLAGIGIANIFANMMGSIRLRRREFARLQSIGFAPKNLWRILAFEMAFVVLRPVLISLSVNALFVIWAVYISPPSVTDYLAVMPVLPFMAFTGAILASAGFACYLSGRKILGADMVESLKDDTLY